MGRGIIAMNLWYLLLIIPVVLIAAYSYSAYKARQIEFESQFDEWWL